MFIDGNGLETLGQAYFLIRRTHTNTNRISYELAETPAHTNRSYEPRLYGWCGETNGVSVYARGLYRVTHVCGNGRVRITKLRTSEIMQALETAGYPDLINQQD